MLTDYSKNSVSLIRLLAYLASIFTTIFESCAPDRQPTYAGHIFGDTVLISVLKNKNEIFLNIRNILNIEYLSEFST